MSLTGCLPPFCSAGAVRALSSPPPCSMRMRRRRTNGGVSVSPAVAMASTAKVGSPSSSRAQKPFFPPREVPPQITHTLPPEKKEIFESLNDWAEHTILPYLKPVEESWQPQDHLPDPCSGSFHDEVAELRERAGALPDDYLVCLVGDMVTEEALPTYQTMLNIMDGGVRDETGASGSGWAVWTRAWAAEENRHGDLMNKYLYLTGRVDMRQVEKTIQYLIGYGMDPRTENDPYMGFIYTTFQERATFISHGNTARHAGRHGDAALARICGTVAADEKRHEAAYARIVEKLFEVDPDYTVRAFARMMRKKVAMPAHLMYDGAEDRLFAHFSAVAQRLGVYTAADYAGIIEFLVGRWGVAGLAAGLSGEGRRAQDFVCSLGPRFRKMEERAHRRRRRRSGRRLLLLRSAGFMAVRFSSEVLSFDEMVHHTRGVGFFDHSSVASMNSEVSSSCRQYSFLTKYLRTGKIMTENCRAMTFR